MISSPVLGLVLDHFAGHKMTKNACESKHIFACGSNEAGTVTARTSRIVGLFYAHASAIFGG